MKKRGMLVISVFLFWVILSLNFASAFEFNGTVYDPNGALLNNSVINITVRSLVGWQVVGYNFTTSNSSGWFNITVAENTNWMYEPKIALRNGTGTSSYIAYVGQSLPAFPSSIYNQLSNIPFYLRDAGTINISAVNSSGHRTTFDYQIKDTRLGYSVAQSFTMSGGVLEANIVVPRDRNYSIMIFPNNSLPISFEWNNFTSTSAYIIPGSGGNAAGNASKYNVTTRTLHKIFNVSLGLTEITGFINATNSTSSSGWDEFSVIAFILEPGNMVHGTQGTIPYNLSSFRGGSATDFFNLTNGYYNITLPVSAEGASYLLLAAVRNGTNHYASFANLTLSYGASSKQINFSMYGLLGKASNISVSNAANFASKKNIAIAKQGFQLVNSTNQSLSQSSVHGEITVDYSKYGAIEFTWMDGSGQESSGNFSLPLLNITGIKEMNIFAGGGNYAPKRIAPIIAQLITDNLANGNVSNISMNSFNPQAIDSVLGASSITMALYISNSTCDVPDPSNACVVGSSTSMQDFNPMGAIIGGGKLSFRMGTGGILIHYVNVDMMASGPPDALFDDKTKNGTAGSGFSAAIRFGSGGPTVYDNVLVSIPYSESTTTGLNDSATVNMSLPVLYDDNWNVIWNVTLNGTNASALAGNYSHYSTRQSEWQYLLNDISCTTNISSFNVSNPCYINTTSNNIWIRLPHFSGTGPNIVGSALVAATSSSSSTSSSTGGGGITSPTFWKNTLANDKQEFRDEGSINVRLEERQRVRVKISNEKHHVGVVDIRATSVTINVSSISQQATLSIGGERKFEVTNDKFYDMLIKLNAIDGKKANLTISYLNEAIGESIERGDITGEIVEEETSLLGPDQIGNGDTRQELNIRAWVALGIAIIIIFLVGWIYYYLKKRR